MMNTVSLSCLGTFLLILMADGVLGDRCQTKIMSCSSSLSDKTMELAGVIQGAGGNATAIATLCGQLKQALDECQDELPQVCQSNDNANIVLQGLQNSYKQTCGPDVTCTVRLQACQQDNGSLMKITRAMTQKPPDMDLVKKLCNTVMTTFKPCLEQVKADCQSVPSVQGSLDSLLSSVEALCRKGSLCGAEISKCQAPFAELGPSSREGEPDFEKMCRLKKVVNACLETEVDAECLSLPELQPIVNSMRSSMASFVCDEQGGGGGGGGGGQCYSRLMSCVRAGPFGGSDCSLLGTQLECVGNQREHCQVSEERVTFKELRTVAIDTCQVLNSSSVDWGNCTAVMSCIANSDLVQKLKGMGMTMPTAETLKKMMDMMLSSQTWCQYLSLASKCHMTAAPSCGVEDSVLASLKENNEKVKNTCFSSSPGSVHYLMWSNVVILVLAVLASWGNQ